MTETYIDFNSDALMCTGYPGGLAINKAPFLRWASATPIESGPCSKPPRAKIPTGLNMMVKSS